MRNVTVYTLLSLDGVAEEPGDRMFEADEAVFDNLAEVVGVHGSITVAHALLGADLVDRLGLVVVPTLAGAGRRLFEDRATPFRLTLTRAASSPTGCVFLSYQRPATY